MRGLDTNVLLRFLLRDDLPQWQAADRYIREAVEAGETCYINNIVLCETVWVLLRSYKLSRNEVVEVLEQILRGMQFQFENRSAVQKAIQSMREGNGDFADYLLGHINVSAGCSETATFDAKLRGSDLFQNLDVLESS